MLKLIGWTLLVLLALLLFESLLLMLTSAQLFNAVAAPAFANLDFLWLLLKNSPWNGLQEIFAQPVLIIGHKQDITDDYISALYFYPLGSLLHLLWAFMLASYVLRKPQPGIKGLVIGSLLLLLTLPNIWLAACCGDVPGWSADVGLRLYVFAEGGDAVSRLKLYETLLPLLLPLRLIIAAVGAILIYRRLAK
jgi:hypothetical protein